MFVSLTSAHAHWSCVLHMFGSDEKKVLQMLDSEACNCSVKVQCSEVSVADV